MPITKMFKFHGQHDGAKRLISFQKGGYPWPTAYNRNFTVNVMFKVTRLKKHHYANLRPCFRR